MTISPPRRFADHDVPDGRGPRAARRELDMPVPRAGSGRGETFRMLYVCTGNVCRSPSAELLTRHLLVGRLGGRAAARIEVSSAGVQAVAGAPVHPGSRSQLAPWGLDGAQSERFVARQLRSAVVDGVDLVLCATPRHRGAVLDRFPELLAVTFGLPEFARLAALVRTPDLPTDLVERARALVVAVRGLRGTVAAPGDDRIPDPIGGSPAEFRRATVMTFEAVRTVVDSLAPRAG